MHINQVTLATVNSNSQTKSKSQNRLRNGLNNEPDSFKPSGTKNRAKQPSFGIEPVSTAAMLLYGALVGLAGGAAAAAIGYALFMGGVYVVEAISALVDSVRDLTKKALMKQVKTDIDNIASENGVSKRKAEKIYTAELERTKLPVKGKGEELGLNKVIGEEQLKLGLTRNVLLPMLQVMDGDSEAKNKVPNLNFFGPRGTGKSYLINALMDHYVQKGGYAEELRFVGDNKEDIATMHRVFDEAEQRFKESGNKKYTMVFLDELEKKAKRTDLPESHAERTSELLKLVKNSKDRGVVFISASNDLNLVNKDLLTKGNTDMRIPVSNIKIHDVADMMNFYIKQLGYPVSSSGIDYAAITNDLKTANLAYKPAEIEAVIRNSRLKVPSKIITTEGIRGAISRGSVTFNEEEQAQFNSELKIMEKLGGVNEDARYPGEKA